MAAAAGAGLAGPAVRTGLLAPGARRHPAMAGQRIAQPLTQQTLTAQQTQALTPWFAGLSNRLSARCNVELAAAKPPAARGA
jgi:hypothetical protein